MGDLETYTRYVGAEAFKAYFRRGGKRIMIGQFEGLRTSGPARLVPERRESAVHHRGYLVGHLIRWSSEHGWAVDGGTKAVMAYASGVAGYWSGVAPRKDDPAEAVHVMASILAERKLARPLTDAEERMLYGWLCDQAGVEVTPERVDRLERLRERRLSRGA